MKLAMLELCKICLNLVKRIQWLERQSSSDLQLLTSEIIRLLNDLDEMIETKFE